jgi:WD40 repeat protein
MPATASAVPAAQLDRDNPWPGLESFEEDAQTYFHGREEETEELLRRVADAPLTVLFGKSGLGKTSLLKAGLFPRLREEHFLPVHMRLDLRPEAPDLVEQLCDGLRAEIARERVDAPPFAAGETLWEYLHRADLELWSEQNHLLTPVLVLDQFEEVFTLGDRFPEMVAHCKVDLGDLAENRIPAALAERLEAEPSTAQRLDLRRMAYKVIVTLREDFLPHLEGWRAAVPSLGRVRVRLLPMRPEQALSAVYDTAPHLMDEPLARRIVGFVAAAQTAASAAQGDGTAQEISGGGEIEPALLSLFCRGLNEQRKRQGKDRFDEQLLEDSRQSIIADYYRSSVEGLPDSVSRFIESDLITEKGFRNSYAKDDAVPDLLTQEQLDRLINRRLLRIEERYGTARIELTHDLLTRAVMADRDQRRVEEEKTALARRVEEEKTELARRVEEERKALAAQRQRQRVRAMALVALVCLAFAGIAAWQWWTAITAKKAAEAAQRSSLSAKLASDSRAEREREPALSFLLATAAWSAKPTVEARSALLSSLLEQPTLRGLLPSRSAVSTVAFSPDGKILASNGGDNAVILWDVASHKPLGEPLTRHEGSVGSIAFSPGGKTLAVADGDTVILWDIGSRKPLGEPLTEHKYAVTSISFSPDGKTLASGSEDGTITLGDVASHKTLGEPLTGHRGSVLSVAFSPDGKILASGSGDGSVILWNVASHNPLGRLQTWREGSIRSVAFSPDGKTLASGDDHRDIILWDVASRKALGPPLFGHKESILIVAFSPDGKTLASGSEDGTVILWNVASHNPWGEPLVGHKGWVSSVAFSPNGKTLAAGTEGNTVMLWDVTGGTALGEPLVGSRDSVLRAALSPDGKTLATGNRDGAVVLWDAARRKPLGGPLAGHRGRVWSVAFSPDGKTLASGSQDGTVILWDVARRTPLGKPLAGREGWVLSVAFSPDGQTLAAGSSDGTIYLWDVTRRIPLGKPLAGLEDVQSISFSPDGKILASGGSTGVLWDIASRTRLGESLAERGGWILGLAFSPDGKTLGAGNGDGTIILWDLAHRASLGDPLTGHEGVVGSIAFSPDGKTLASGGEDKTILLWDVARRTRLGEKLAGNQDQVQSVSFSPDGKTLVSCGIDGTVIFWDIDPASWSRRACLIASRNLTCDEWRRYLFDEPYRKLCPDLPGPERCEAQRPRGPS